jgi:hypothetical protein
VASSKCLKTDISGDEDYPPKAFLLGHVLTYAATVCGQEAGMSPGSESKDAITYFANRGKIKLSDPPMRSMYSIMVGMALAESGGRWCCGCDRAGSACKDSRAAGTEAGVHQTSYDSLASTGSSVLRALFDQFKGKGKDDPECLWNEFGGSNTRCPVSDLQNFGSGEPLEFQRLSKYCPAFATRYAAIMGRIQRQHYWTLGGGSGTGVKVAPACTELLKQVEEVVECQ